MAVDLAQPELTPTSALRLVIFGGEALDFGRLRPWFKRHGPERPQLVNMYGITETTVHATYRPLVCADARGPEGASAGGASSIGSPIPDLQLYVLDRHMQPVPIGVRGELFVGGAGLARGYARRPGLTAERFLPDPFSGEEGALMYRTGDLACFSETGSLDYLGRADDQVKIRGFRIEPDEIRNVLQEHPGVREAAGIGPSRRRRRRRRPGAPTCPLTPYDATKPRRASGSMRRFLRERLPEYMLPAAIVALDELPLNANGKLDRRALPRPGRARPELDEEFRAPRLSEERTLAAIWSEVLGVERVGIDDDFFALGGDSIRAVQVVAPRPTRRPRGGTPRPLSTSDDRRTRRSHAQRRGARGAFGSRRRPLPCSPTLRAPCLAWKSRTPTRCRRSRPDSSTRASLRPIIKAM